MRKIIEFIIDQKLDSLDEFPSLIEPIVDKFGLDYGIAEGIINTVIEWETNLSTIDSLELVLHRKFPSIVTK